MFNAGLGRSITSSSFSHMSPFRAQHPLNPMPIFSTCFSITLAESNLNPLSNMQYFTFETCVLYAMCMDTRVPNLNDYCYIGRIAGTFSSYCGTYFSLLLSIPHRNDDRPTSNARATHIGKRKVIHLIINRSI